MKRKLIFTSILLLICFSTIYGQGQQIISKKEIYTIALNCYVDSVLKAYEYDRSGLARRYRYLKFIAVADTSISNYLPDMTRYILWKKVEPKEFFKTKNLQKSSKVVFLRSAETDNEITKVPILIYYSHNKEIISYSRIYYVLFSYQNDINAYLLNGIKYQGGITR
jgi:hypothetical protein